MAAPAPVATRDSEEVSFVLDMTHRVTSCIRNLLSNEGLTTLQKAALEFSLQMLAPPGTKWADLEKGFYFYVLVRFADPCPGSAFEHQELHANARKALRDALIAGLCSLVGIRDAALWQFVWEAVFLLDDTKDPDRKVNSELTNAAHKNGLGHLMPAKIWKKKWRQRAASPAGFFFAGWY